MNKTPFITVLVLVVIAAIILIWQAGSIKRSATEIPVGDDIACTMDAKMCPDGSYVGRIAPSCEFAACPGEASPATSAGVRSTVAPTSAPVSASWKTESNNEVSFRYPETISTKYVTATGLDNVWAPAIRTAMGGSSCKEEIQDVGVATSKMKKTVNGTVYCVTVASEGAAGSTMRAYTYEREHADVNKTFILEFTLRYPQCGNYDENDQIACNTEQGSFNPDILADKILKTATLR